MDGDATNHHGGVAGDDNFFPDADSFSEDEAQSKLTATETHYNNNGYGIKTIVAMAIGLKNVDNTGPLVDVMKPPWTKLAKKELKLTIVEFRTEIRRRAPADASPRCGNWTVARCTDWLIANPIKEDDDVSFIRKIVQTTIDECEGAEQEALAVATAAALPSSSSGGQWRGNLPYLRLIMCLVADDNIRNAYLHRGDAMTRTQLDARNSTEVREATVFEMLADKWNDSTFNPVVPVSDVHEDFRQPTNVSHQMVKHLTPATPIKIKNYLSSMRADLSRMIKNWELSGQGDGSLLEEAGSVDGRNLADDDDSSAAASSMQSAPVPKPSFGQLARRSNAAMECRENFLAGKPSYLLIFWELADQCQLLASTLQRLDRAAVPGADDVPPVYTINRASPNDIDSMFGATSAMESTLSAFNTQFNQQCERRDMISRQSDQRRDMISRQSDQRQYTVARHSELTDSLRSYRVQLRRAPVDEKDFWLDEIALLEKEIEDNLAERRRLDRLLQNT